MQHEEHDDGDELPELPAGCLEMALQEAKCKEDADDIMDKLAAMGEMLTPAIVKLSVKRHYLQIDLAMHTLQYNNYYEETRVIGRPTKRVMARREKLESKMNAAKRALDACVDMVVSHGL